MICRIVRNNIRIRIIGTIYGNIFFLIKVHSVITFVFIRNPQRLLVNCITTFFFYMNHLDGLMFYFLISSHQRSRLIRNTERIMSRNVLPN